MVTVPAAVSRTTGSNTEGQYIVKSGDTMSHIAKDQGVALEELEKANSQIQDANKIYPGQELKVPNPRRRRGNQAPPAGRNGGISNEVFRARVDSTGQLARGARGQAVSDLQGQLGKLGFSSGPTDGAFGPQTQGAVRAFQRRNNLIPDGIVGPRTREALAGPNPTRGTPPANAAPTSSPSSANDPAPRLARYEPGSPEARALFREAADLAGVPRSWADSTGLHQILRRESGGRVGIPNYTYGARARDPARWGEIHEELRQGRKTARSSATGLGQLLLSNVDRFYPNGRAGIGDPVQEAAGMLRYIKARYGSPDNAWRLYGTRHEGY